MKAIHLQSPMGSLTVTEKDGVITSLDWVQNDGENTPLLTEAKAQLEAYFDGKLTEFDLPLHVEGSEFQQRVCDAISAIPFGDTLTYGQIAKDLGAPAQAIGNACGGNPIPIIIPCHRVLGSQGLGGFSGRGGVETKVWLLKHEGAGGLLI